jgi:hypothetical protein
VTISESVEQWLRGYEGGFEPMDGISTDRLAEEDEAFGMFKTPQDTEIEFVDGSRDVTVHYLFLARQPSKTDGLRKDAHEWLEGLERWIRTQGMRRRLPVLDQGRHCNSVRVSNSYAAEEQTDAETVYQIGLEINYYEEAV